MGIANSLPKAWKKINELINGKVNKSQDTDGDETIAYISKVKNMHFSEGWYKIAEIEAYQSTTNTIITLDGATGYNDKAIGQNTSAKIIIRGSNGNPVGLSVACLNMGNVNFITKTSYFKFPNTDKYEIFVKFGTLHISNTLVSCYNEDRFIKLFNEKREENASNPSNHVDSIIVMTNDNSPAVKSSNGWVKFANGLIIQWGIVSDFTQTPSGGTAPLIAYPINFTAQPRISLCGQGTTSGGYGAYMCLIPWDANTVNFRLVSSGIVSAYSNPSNPVTTETLIRPGVFWIAVGY